MESTTESVINVTTQFELPMNLRYFHGICAITIAFVGIIGNVITTFKLIKNSSKKEKCNLYLLNLTINNLLSCSIILPLIGINSFFIRWIYGRIFCQIFGFVMYIILCAEVNSLILLSLNRYFRIVHPQWYSKIYENRRNNIMILTYCWLFYSSLLLLPLTSTWGKFGYDHTKNYCSLMRNDSYALFLAGSLMGTSIPVLFLSYASIFSKYRKSKRTIADASKTMPDRKAAVLAQKELRLLRTILTVLACYALCYVPYMAFVLFDPNMKKLGIWAHTICTYFNWGHVAINPLIYTLRHSKKI